MAKNNSPQNKNDKLIKVLQIAAGVFMALMFSAVVFAMIKYDIKPSNAAEISTYLTGGALSVAIIIIVFSVVKSFALVFPPALIFAVSGIFFENIWIAILVNLISTLLSLALPYFLGRFTGASMVESLKNRFPKVRKIDEFAGANESLVVFLVKASGAIPSDLTSLLFGAMSINFKKYYIFSNLGLIPINVLWTLLGNKGDVSNPLSFLYILPIPIFALGASLLMSKLSKKNGKKSKED